MNDRDSLEGAYAYSILDSAVRFDATWYDKSITEIRNIIETQSANGYVYIKYNYWELGHDEKWLKEQSRNLNNDLMKIKRELLLEWTITNDRSPFSEEQLNTVSAYIKKEPIQYLYIGEYKFTIYEELTNLFYKNWIIAIDIGGGLSQDFTVISIIDPNNKKLKGIFRTNCIDAVELVKLVRMMLNTYFPEAVIIPERTGIGQAVVQMMMHDPIVSQRLYYEEKDKLVEKKIEDVRLNNKYVKTKSKVRVYGQDTTKQSRDIMFNQILSYIVNEEPEAIICPELFDEMKTLERSTRGNKIEARQGAHDDVIMSYLIGLYALFRGRNINKFVSLQGDFSEDDPNAVNTREEKNKRIKNNMARLYSDPNKMPTTISTLIDIQDSILLEKSQPRKKKSKDTFRKVKRLLE